MRKPLTVKPVLRIAVAMALAPLVLLIAMAFAIPNAQGMSPSFDRTMKDAERKQQPGTQPAQTPPAVATPTSRAEPSWRVQPLKDEMEGRVSEVVAWTKGQTVAKNLEPELELRCGPRKDKKADGVRVWISAGTRLRLSPYSLDGSFGKSLMRYKYDDGSVESGTLSVLWTRFPNSGSTFDITLAGLLAAQRLTVEFDTDGSDTAIARFSLGGINEAIAEVAGYCAGGSTEALLKASR